MANTTSPDGKESSPEEIDRKATKSKPIQTSIRVDEELLREFRKAAAARGESNMNSAVSTMMAEWVKQWQRDPIKFAGSDAGTASDYTADPHGYYMAWLPTTVIIRDVREGMVIYADPTYLQLVNKPSVNTHKPSDDWDEVSAREMMQRHEEVRDQKQPLLSAENAVIDGKPLPRLRIRFPIYQNGDDRTPVIAVGILGLDLNKVREAVSTIDTTQHGSSGDSKQSGPRTEQFEELRPGEVVVPPQCRPSLVKDFIASLPLLATIKGKDDIVICVNPAYCKVTGKKKEEAEGKRALENWQGNPLAAMIMYHDLLVRETKATYISVEDIPTKVTGSQKRVNIRFPIFDGGEVVMTGCLGLDYWCVRDVLDNWRENRSYCRRLDIVGAGGPKAGTR